MTDESPVNLVFFWQAFERLLLIAVYLKNFLEQAHESHLLY